MAASPIALMAEVASSTFTSTISSFLASASHHSQTSHSTTSSPIGLSSLSSSQSSISPTELISTTSSTTSTTTTSGPPLPAPSVPSISLSLSDLRNNSLSGSVLDFSEIDDHNCTDSDYPLTTTLTHHSNSTNTNFTSAPNCKSAWDGVSCWYQTLSGHEAVIPCFSNLNGINYDTTQNASRLCLPNGTWAGKADYDRCKPLKIEQLPIEHLYTPSIYYIGYGLSLCALTVALWIFLYFKDLRCVRNTIHTNLMITYLLIAVCWITTDRLHSYPSPLSRKASCMIVILLTYLMGTNFFWMFVEGLYLYILVVKTFSIEFVKIQNYAFIGWGLPAVVVLVWTLTKVYFSRYESLLTECPWQAQDEFDYIYKVPILLVLLINIFFLGKIMWVLIIKLRSANSAESKQYRKAAKALLVLIPLLGVGYILVLVTPTHSTAKKVFQYLQAILVSTQGFTVAVLYCFCNGEVRNSVRHHFERFRLRRTLRYGGDYPAKKSTYYRSTAYCQPQMHHHQASSNSTGHRSSYAFRSLKNNGRAGATGNGTNGNGSGSGASGRFSNASDTARLYRSTMRGEKCRDSCGSFTTTNSYLVTGNSINSGSPTATVVAGGTIVGLEGVACGVDVISDRDLATHNNHNGNSGNGNGGGYHSVATTPDSERLNMNCVDDQIDIELQPI